MDRRCKRSVEEVIIEMGGIKNQEQVGQRLKEKCKQIQSLKRSVKRCRIQ